MGLVVRGLTKAYGTKRVLDDVDLDVANGEIHALLGPNGSGKSTLIGCLSGSIVPNAGTIDLDGTQYTSLKPREAILAGAATIYQHFSLVPTLTVADNVFLGDEIRVRGIVDHTAQREKTAELLAQFGRPMTPDTLVASLSVGDRQLVEIAKALRHQPRLLILDEPTAAIGEHEVSLLMAILKRLRSERMAILYVTHLLPEVFALADRVTVLRDGRVVLARPIGEIDEAQVVAAIAPQIRRSERGAGSAARDETPMLSVQDLEVAWVGPVSFTVSRGEVVGLFGLLGSGRTEILEAIYGLRAARAGSITVDGTPHRPRAPRDALRRSIALVPSDRLRYGILARLTSLDNVELPHVTRLSRLGVRRPAVEIEEFRRVADRLSLKPPDPNVLAWTFSGGNQQKLVVGRWLSPSAVFNLMLLDEPTQGIDVGARADLYRLVRELAHGEGRGVLFTSSDPEETLALADRVAVLRRGRIVAEMAGSLADEELLLGLAHGARSADARVTLLEAVT